MIIDDRVPVQLDERLACTIIGGDRRGRFAPMAAATPQCVEASDPSPTPLLLDARECVEPHRHSFMRLMAPHFSHAGACL
jgi:hypothetical protein